MKIPLTPKQQRDVLAVVDDLGLRLPMPVRAAVEGSIRGHWSSDPIDHAVDKVNRANRR